jgi:hypothetical protein
MGTTRNKWQRDGAYSDTNFMISGANRKSLQQMHRHLYNIHGKQDGVNFLYDANGIELDIDFDSVGLVPVQVTGYIAGEYRCSVYKDGIDKTATATSKTLIIGGEDEGIFYDSGATTKPWFMARMIDEDTYETTAEIIVPNLDDRTTTIASDLYLQYDASAKKYKAIRADKLIIALLKLVPNYGATSDQIIRNQSGSISWQKYINCCPSSSTSSESDSSESSYTDSSESSSMDDCICPEDAPSTVTLSAGAWVKSILYSDTCGGTVQFIEQYILQNDLTLTKVSGECRWTGSGSTEYYTQESYAGTNNETWTVRLDCDSGEWIGSTGPMRTVKSGNYPTGTYSGYSTVYGSCYGLFWHTGSMTVS